MVRVGKLRRFLLIGSWRTANEAFPQSLFRAKRQDNDDVGSKSIIG